MPVLLPIVAAFAAGAAGYAAVTAVGATALGLVAGYATIAGAVLTGVGAVTGSKDLMKIGAVLSIGGGLGTLATSAASTAAEAADGAGGMALQEGSTPASVAGDTAGATGEAAAGGAATNVATLPPVTQPPLMDPSASGTLGQAGSQAALTPNVPNADSLMGNATRGTIDGASDYGSSSGAGAPGTSTTISPATANLGKVNDAAANLTGTDVQSWWQKAQAAGGSVANFIKDNPALVKIGGDALGSMFGPQAEALDWQKSIYNRNRANLNAPIALTYRKP